MISTDPKDFNKEYDFVIIGSGAAGGIAAHVLAAHGKKALMIDAGRNYDPTSETPMFELPDEAPLRGEVVPGRMLDYFEAAMGGYEIKGEDYSVFNQKTDQWQNGKEGFRYGNPQNFMWYRSRLLGGRTNNWGRVTPRMGPYDFKPVQFDGKGFDWPISYEDLAPFYSKVERLIGIFGKVTGLENNPDGIFLPPPRYRLWDHMMDKALSGLGKKLIPNRAAILTKPKGDRSACFYATSCTRGCSTGAAFQSPNVLIHPAVRSGHLDLMVESAVSKILVDKSGKAKGVEIVNKALSKSGQVSKSVIKAKQILLGASTCETARILLNSKNTSHPDGLGNHSGHLGKWLTDSPKTSIKAYVPALAGHTQFNDEGVVHIRHSYSPWTDWKGLHQNKYKFTRGYQIGGGSGARSLPFHYSFHHSLKKMGPLYGKKMIEQIRHDFGAFVSLSSNGEMIPNEKSYCEIDPSGKVDQWGTPALRFHFEWGENEVEQAKHQQTLYEQIIDAVGGEIVKKRKPKKMMTTGGSVKHEVGTTRMSAGEDSGVTDKFGRVWGCSNVRVIDGGVFVSHSFKNPTLTIMAHCWRTTEHLIKSHS